MSGVTLHLKAFYLIFKDEIWNIQLKGKHNKTMTLYIYKMDMVMNFYFTYPCISLQSENTRCNNS